MTRDLDPAGEDGRITLLVLGLAVLVIALVLTSAAATSIHIQRRQLLTCADSIAIWVAGYADAGNYYQESELNLGQDRVDQVALDRLTELSATTCDVGLGVELQDVQTKDSDVQVSLSMMPRLPVVGSTLQNLGQVGQIRVASTARLH